MKRLTLIIFLIARLFIINDQLSIAQTGTWRAYMSYAEPQQIVKGGNQLFVRASNDLYSYNLNDHSITTYDKINGLSDTYITHIAWNTSTSHLVIVYKNSNIDVMDHNGNIINISALYARSMTQDKTVNGIYIHDAYAYLATGFGIVKLNTADAEISETYILNANIQAVGISNDNIYARAANGTVYTAQLSQNLIDSHYWTTTYTYPTDIFNTDNNTWNQYINIVKSLKLDSPKYNNFGYMKFIDNTLYTCGGGWMAANLVDFRRPATIQLYHADDDSWTFLPEDTTTMSDIIANNEFIDMMVLSVNPLDHKHVIGTGRTGMFEFYDGQFLKYHNKDNSLLKSVVGIDKNTYIMALGSLFDYQGNFWCVVSQTDGDNLVEYTKDKQWVSHSKPSLYINGQSLPGMLYMIEDSRHLLWFVNSHWTKTGIFCYDPWTDGIVNEFYTLTNQDGTSYQDYRPFCLAEDLEGNILIGTNIGLFVVEKDNISNKDTYVTQIKVPRNDGTNYADYLMSGVNISCMIVDGGGRKWFGTSGSGVYLISADNMTQLQHFTTQNSPLLSNNIESIAINHHTGEVFFGTEDGLCSYMSDATAPVEEMQKDDVYAYPNPVTPEYNGLITIVGLSLDADVKILSSSGKLIAEGRSNGGTFTWDGKDRSGNRVASGIYMVATATSDGKKGTVCKIAIIR